MNWFCRAFCYFIPFEDKKGEEAFPWDNWRSYQQIIYIYTHTHTYTTEAEGELEKFILSNWNIIECLLCFVGAF